MSSARSTGSQETVPQWNTSLESFRKIVGIRHPEFAEPEDRVEARVDEWLRFFNECGFFPPGAVTKDGMMVDGHHRLIAARKLKQNLPCVFVVSVRVGASHVWAITGSVCLVE